MDPRTLSVAALTAIAAAASAAAQGPVYRERWGYLHLEHRRAQVLQALRAADNGTEAADRSWVAAAQMLLAPDQGIPFAPVASTLAALRGTEADAVFLLRAMLSAYVLPEVADPDGENELCRRTNVSLFLPFAMPLPGQLVFDFEVLDRDGERVWSAQLDVAPDLEDLRMARVTAPIPAVELADGTYRVRVETRVDGEGPGPHDPVLEWPFHVARGYQARCTRAFAAVADRSSGLGDDARALLQGLSLQVQRAYAGEAFDVASDAVRDLERLERALANLADGEHVLAGIAGDVAVHLTPSTPRGLAAVLRLPEDFVPGARRHRPLVVFAAATPSYDTTARRPTSPPSRGPLWSAHELATFGRGLDCDVAWVESPGELRDYADHLRTGLAVLRRLLGSGDAPVVLVADGEAATVVALHVASLRTELDGLVLVGAGAMTGKALDALDGLPVRMQPVPGLVSSEGLVRSLDYAAPRELDVLRLSERAAPWPFAVPLLQPEIEAFAARVFAR